jgi:hypothetical protein
MAQIAFNAEVKIDNNQQQQEVQGGEDPFLSEKSSEEEIPFQQEDREILALKRKKMRNYNGI